MSCHLHFSPSGQDYVWRNLKEAFNLHYLFPAVKLGDESLLLVQLPVSALKPKQKYYKFYIMPCIIQKMLLRKPTMFPLFLNIRQKKISSDAVKRTKSEPA